MGSFGCSPYFILTIFNQPMFKLQLDVEIPAERVEDLLSMFTDGHSGYWASPILLPFREDGYLDTKAVIEGESTIALVDRLEDVDYVIGKEEIERGLQRMATDYPNHLADVKADNSDAITADVFIQCCVFDKLVYS